MRPHRLSESLPSNGEDSTMLSIQDANPVERLQTTPTSLRPQLPRPCPCVQSLRVRHATAHSQQRSGPVWRVLLRVQGVFSPALALPSKVGVNGATQRDRRMRSIAC